MDTLQSIRGRRSIRAYAPRALERATIETLIAAAAQAPTPPASGARPWMFSVMQGGERLAIYGEQVKAFSRKHPPPGRAAWISDPAFKVFWGAPTLIVISARKEVEEAAWDCCRAGQNLMLAAHAMGLGACWVAAPLAWLRTTGIADAFGIPRDFAAVAPIVVGHPAETPPPPRRDPPLVSWRGDAPAEAQMA
jgi:nitroreductase